MKRNIFEHTTGKQSEEEGEPREDDVVNKVYPNVKKPAENAQSATVAVKVFRDSGRLASYLRRIYITSDANPRDSNVSSPPPLHEALRTYIREHHHHKRPPEEEEEGTEEEEEEEEDNNDDDDDDRDLASSGHDANEPGVYAARELLAMFLVRGITRRDVQSHPSPSFYFLLPASESQNLNADDENCDLTKNMDACMQHYGLYRNKYVLNENGV